MLKIELPGSNNLFWIEDNTFESFVENELYHSFYPYATKESNKTVLLQNRDVFIQVEDLLRIETCKQVTFRRYNDISHVYKTAFSIIRENLQIQNDFSYLHGAAISIQNKVCLLLAETGAGKSTLGVYVDQEKEGLCLTDDLIIFQKTSRTIIPLSKHAHLRNESRELLKKGSLMFYNDIVERYEHPLSDNRFKQTWKLNYILILHRNMNIQTIQPSSMPLVDVLNNMFLPYQMKNNLNSAVKISKDVPIYNIFYHDLEEAKNLILSLN